MSRALALVLLTVAVGGCVGGRLQSDATLCDAMVAQGYGKGPCMSPNEAQRFREWKAENEHRWREAHPNVKPTDPQ